MANTAAMPILGEKFVTLGVGRETFAVDVESVREILDPRPMAALPHAPPFLSGIIEVRGRAVPVIDLPKKLGFATSALDAHSRIVVVEVPLAERRLVVGLLTDRVFEVTALDDQTAELPPDIGVRWRSDYIQAIGRRNGGFVIIFDLAHLFSGAETALLAEEAE